MRRPLGHVTLPQPQASAVPPIGTPDAREAISLDPARRPFAPSTAEIGSQLTTRERAEYHYVERDLRNIAVLTLLMLVGLVAAWVVFTQMGLTG